MKHFKLIFAVVVAALALSACTDHKHFSVSGSIAGAAGETIYLCREGLDSVVVCDSAVLSKTGSFRMKGYRPAAPEFYSLRIDSLSMWLVVDSTEKIEVKTDKKFASCGISGSQQSVELQRWLGHIRQMDDSLKTIVGNCGNDKQKAERAIFTAVNAYKDTVQNYIQHNSVSPVSYFLLFKKVGFGISPFDPFSPEDKRSFAMVANAWNKRYPDALRSQHLKETVTAAKKINAAIRFQQATVGAARTGYIDLSFPDVNGKKVSLSSKKGKNVLLQFCYLPHLSEEVLASLAQMLNQYKKKGFDIYMVTFDKNIELWKKSAAKLPFTVVLDEKQQSPLTYNFTEIPTNFFLDKNGNIIGKDVTLQDVAEFLEAQ